MPLIVAVLAIALTSGCAAIRPAEMELPDTFAGVTPQTIEGLGGGTVGRFQLGALRGTYRRGAGRLTIAGGLALDRAELTYTLEPDGVSADCRLRADTATLGAFLLPLKQPSVDCEFSRGGQPLPQRLAVQGVDVAPDTRDERRGRFEAGDRVIELQSLHRVQGSSRPLATPIGYLMLQDGRPVAALELNGLRPRLWLRPAEFDEGTGKAVAQAALALALMWDPGPG